MNRSARVVAGVVGFIGLALVSVTGLAGGGCVMAKDARIAAENAVDPKTVHEYPWGRVECGEGQVCSEVAVARVDIHGDPVEVTLENKTLESVAVQVQIETFNDRGERTDRSGFHDVALAPRSQSVLTLWQELEGGDKIVIRMRARGA